MYLVLAPWWINFVIFHPFNFVIFNVSARLKRLGKEFQWKYIFRRRIYFQNHLASSNLSAVFTVDNMYRYVKKPWWTRGHQQFSFHLVLCKMPDVNFFLYTWMLCQVTLWDDAPNFIWVPPWNPGFPYEIKVSCKSILNNLESN